MGLRIVCAEHGKQEFIYVESKAVCIKCFSEENKRTPFRIIKETEMGTVIPFPVKNEDKD